MVAEETIAVVNTQWGPQFVGVRPRKQESLVRRSIGLPVSVRADSGRTVSVA